jgi:hypothetical protein
MVVAGAFCWDGQLRCSQAVHIAVAAGGQGVRMPGLHDEQAGVRSINPSISVTSVAMRFTKVSCQPFTV